MFNFLIFAKIRRSLFLPIRMQVPMKVFVVLYDSQNYVQEIWNPMVGALVFLNNWAEKALPNSSYSIHKLLSIYIFVYIYNYIMDSFEYLFLFLYLSHSIVVKTSWPHLIAVRCDRWGAKVPSLCLPYIFNLSSSIYRFGCIL